MFPHKVVFNTHVRSVHAFSLLSSSCRCTKVLIYSRGVIPVIIPFLMTGVFSAQCQLPPRAPSFLFFAGGGCTFPSLLVLEDDDELEDDEELEEDDDETAAVPGVSFLLDCTFGAGEAATSVQEFK